MSFTQDVKRELDTVAPETEHCRRAELSGLIFSAGVFEIAGHAAYSVRLSFALPATARRALTLLRPLGAEAELRTVDSTLTGHRYEVILDGSPRNLRMLHELGVLSDAFVLQLTIAPGLVKRRCCLIALLRGVFLGCGSISTPGKAVHAELTVENRDLAEQLARLWHRLGLEFKVAERARNVACYTKRGETAADLLAILGAHNARLRWEEHLVLNQVRERANRLANCDQANARRASETGRRQVEAARKVLADRSLSPPLRVTAELRIRFPFLNLAELGGRSNPPLSKSAINHRLRQIESLASEIE